MSTITIGNVKDDLGGMLHGTSVNSITQLNRKLARAARVVLTKIDPAETLRSTTIEDVSSAENDYAAPTDLKDQKVRFFGNADTDEARPFGSQIGGEFNRPVTANSKFQIVTMDSVKYIRTYVPHTDEQDYLLEYYSDCGFRDASTWTTTVTDDNTILNFGETAYEIFLNEALIICAQGLQGENASADVDLAKRALNGGDGEPGLYAGYLEGNPNETIAPRQTWY